MIVLVGIHGGIIMTGRAPAPYPVTMTALRLDPPVPVPPRRARLTARVSSWRTRRCRRPVVRWALPLSGLVVSATLFVSVAAAHEGLHEQLATTTRLIAEAPADARLYVRRADLYRRHGDWAAAWEDLRQAARHDESVEQLDVVRARLLLDCERLSEAREAVEQWLARRPDDGPAILLRAEIVTRCGTPAEALATWDAALSRIDARPDHYITRADVVLAGEGPRDELATRAVEGLDGGLQRLGPAVALVQRAVELELELGRHDAALARVDAMAARFSRHERWTVRRAEILEHAGRADEARRTYAGALAEIRALRPKQRDTRATRELTEHVERRLAALSRPARSSAGQGQPED